MKIVTRIGLIFLATLAWSSTFAHESRVISILESELKTERCQNVSSWVFADVGEVQQSGTLATCGIKIANNANYRFALRYAENESKVWIEGSQFDEVMGVFVPGIRMPGTSVFDTFVAQCRGSSKGYYQLGHQRDRQTAGKTWLTQPRYWEPSYTTDLVNYIKDPGDKVPN
jgi:hypothetical protein